MAAIRQQINVAVPVRTVWDALTTEQGLSAWWGSAARVDPRQGGLLVISVQRDGETFEERGLFHELRPTRRVEIAWDSATAKRTQGSRLVFQLARDGDETRVSVIQSSGASPEGEEEEEGARADLSEVWRQRLFALRAHLEGE